MSREIAQRVVASITTMNRGIAAAVAATLLIFGATMLYEAISRHFFNSPTIWAFEFSKMSFGFYMIWAGAYTLQRGEHINMDIFYSKWSPRGKAIIDSLTFVFFLIFVSTLLYFAARDAANAYAIKETSNSALSQPLYQWRISLVIGVFLLFLQGLAEFVKNLWFAIYNEAL